MRRRRRQVSGLLTLLHAVAEHRRINGYRLRLADRLPAGSDLIDATIAELLTDDESAAVDADVTGTERLPAVPDREAVHEAWWDLLDQAGVRWDSGAWVPRGAEVVDFARARNGDERPPA